MRACIGRGRERRNTSCSRGGRCAGRDPCRGLSSSADSEGGAYREVGIVTALGLGPRLLLLLFVVSIAVSLSIILSISLFVFLLLSPLFLPLFLPFFLLYLLLSKLGLTVPSHRERGCSAARAVRNTPSRGRPEQGCGKGNSAVTLLPMLPTCEVHEKERIRRAVLGEHCVESLVRAGLGRS